MRRRRRRRRPALLIKTDAAPCTLKHIRRTYINAPRALSTDREHVRFRGRVTRALVNSDPSARSRVCGSSAALHARTPPNARRPLHFTPIMRASAGGRDAIRPRRDTGEAEGSCMHLLLGRRRQRSPCWLRWHIAQLRWLPSVSARWDDERAGHRQPRRVARLVLLRSAKQSTPLEPLPSDTTPSSGRL